MNTNILVNIENILRTKCAIVGEVAVGKTSLTQIFLTDGREFPKNYNMTFGVDLRVKNIAIPDSHDMIEMFIYDSSGRDIYTSCLPKYWNAPNMLIAVFDVTSQSTLDSISQWVSLVRNEMPQRSVSTSPGILFGNKTDLTERRVVSPKVGTAVAEKLGLTYFEGSAKENKGIEEPFHLLAYEWHKLYYEKKASFALIA